MRTVKDEPFFAYIHYMEPHQPYEPPEELLAPFLPEGGEQLHSSLTLPPLREGDTFPPLSDLERESLIALYDAEIAQVDLYVGNVIDFLKSEDLYDSSLIVLVADHGEQFYEHEAWGHPRELWRELLKVPFIVKWPEGRGAGMKVTTHAELVDLRRTILGLAEIEIDGPDHGDDLTALVFDPPVGDEPTRAWGESPAWGYTVRDPAWTFMRRMLPGPEGFRLHKPSDTTEADDVSLENPEVIDEYDARLADWVPRVQSDARAGGTMELEQGRREMLEALGYL